MLDLKKQQDKQALSDRRLLLDILGGDEGYTNLANYIFDGVMSPIERQLFVAFILTAHGMGVEATAFTLTLQPRIQVEERTLVPDALIETPARRLLVECDGYKYHSDEATFTADRARDRAFLAMGYLTVRFSASEILATPRSCAGELLTLGVLCAS